MELGLSPGFDLGGLASGLLDLECWVWAKGPDLTVLLDMLNEDTLVYCQYISQN